MGMDLTVAATPALDTRLQSKLNWLRAGVLGANDGIVSTAGIVMGVAGAQASSGTLFIAGMAGLVAGALSMAGGEYVSVSTQKDTEMAALDGERRELTNHPDRQLQALTEVYRAKGISAGLARHVAVELTEHDALAAHAEARLGIDSTEHTSPTQAALASMVSFIAGALVPLLGMVLAPTDVRVPTTIVAVTAALLLTGFVSARLGGAAPGRAMMRNLVVGALAMGVTFVVGSLVGGQL